MRISVEHSLGQGDMVDALAALALAEQVDGPLVKALRNAHPREPIRERYLVQVVFGFQDAGRALDRQMGDNVVALASTMLADPAIRKARGARAPLRLTQAQLDELLLLIRLHYRSAIRVGVGAGWGIDPATEARWKAAGVLAPDVRLGGLVGDAFTAGRLAQILHDGMSLAEMRRMAMARPITRESALALEVVTERMAFDLSGGLGYRAEQAVGRLVLGRNAQAVQAILAAYRAGTLARTPTNRDGLSPEEAAATATGGTVQGWRGLARELRNRMAAEDRTRDWERVAATMTRQSYNWGAVQAMAEEGVEELWYDVHADACERCKDTYLNPDGSPRIFTVASVLQTISETGGANYDRKPADWLPNAVLHPWCQCRPQRRIVGITPKGRTTRGS